MVTSRRSRKIERTDADGASEANGARVATRVGGTASPTASDVEGLGVGLGPVEPCTSATFAEGRSADRPAEPEHCAPDREIDRATSRMKATATVETPERW